MQGGEGQGEDQKIHGRTLPDALLRTQPAGEIAGHGAAHQRQHQSEGNAQHQTLPYQIPGILFFARSDALGRLDAEAHGQGAAQPAQQPCAGGHQTDSGAGVPPQMADHGRVDILHGDRGDLRQNGRDAQLQSQQRLLPQRQLLTAAQ